MKHDKMGLSALMAVTAAAGYFIRRAKQKRGVRPDASIQPFAGEDRPARDRTEEAGLESFPASDPPAVTLSPLPKYD